MARSLERVCLQALMLTAATVVAGCFYSKYSVVTHVPIESRSSDELLDEVDRVVRPLGFELLHVYEEQRIYVYTGRVVPKDSEVVKWQTEDDWHKIRGVVGPPEPGAITYYVGTPPEGDGVGRVTIAVDGDTGRLFLRDHLHDTRKPYVATIEATLREHLSGSDAPLGFERKMDIPW